VAGGKGKVEKKSGKEKWMGKVESKILRIVCVGLY
jgi:hypothetical protein